MSFINVKEINKFLSKFHLVILRLDDNTRDIRHKISI